MSQKFNNYKNSESDDETLWRGFLAGDREALSTLFLRYYRPLFNYGMNLVYNEDSVKDGIQKLFLRLWRKKDELSDVDSVNFYLLVSLKRILLRNKERIESRYQRNHVFAKDFQQIQIDIEEQLLEDKIQSERKEMFKKALENLTNRQKEVINLRLNYGLRNEEIAELINISHQAVRNIIYSATKRMKSVISDSKD